MNMKESRWSNIQKLQEEIVNNDSYCAFYIIAFLRAFVIKYKKDISTYYDAYCCTSGISLKGIGKWIG